MRVAGLGPGLSERPDGDATVGAHGRQRCLDALAGQPVQHPDKQNVIAADAGVIKGLAQLLAVLAGPRGRAVEDVLGGDLETAALGPGAQLGELGGGLLVVGADARPDSAAAELTLCSHDPSIN